MKQATCSGCGRHFTDEHGPAVTLTRHYRELFTTDDYCDTCEHEIAKALRRLHRKETRGALS